MRSGIVSLGDFTITTAATYVGDWVTEFDGLLGLNLQMRLAYGSGGTLMRAYLQTSFDQETTPVDIACVVFGVASEVLVLNFSGLTPKTTQVTPSDGALADDTALDGILGDRFRLKVVSTGVYAGSTVLSARVCSR
jgi:hypothetical protein